MNPYRAFSKEHIYAYSIRVSEVDERQEVLCIHFWVKSIDSLCLGCVARRASIYQGITLGCEVLEYSWE